MVDVFISYSRADQAAVARLAHMVEAEGYKVWWDADLPPHQSYGDVITAKILAARAAIVVWSASSVQSEWVRAEADMARSQKKLIQTSLDDVMPPLPFNQIQYATIGDWQGEPDHTGWRKIKASLTELCGPRDEGLAPLPPRPMPGYAMPPPAVSSAHAPIAGTARWPMFAGIAVGVIGLAAAVGMFVMRGNDAPAAPQPQQTVANVPATGASAPVDQVAPAGSAAPLPNEQKDGSTYNIDATVEDPDGYSNVRSGPSTSSAIVARVQVGERFATFQQTGTWWRVRLGDGTEGFVARRLIRLPGENSANQNGGAIDPAAAASMTFADSSTRLLTPADLAGLGPATLRVARNEIYARKGRRFRDPWLRDYFANFSWYTPRFEEVDLTAVEQRNIALIERAEARFGN